MKHLLPSLVATCLLSPLLSPPPAFADGPVAGVADIAAAGGVFSASATNAVDMAGNERRLIEAWDKGVPPDVTPMEDTSFPIAHYPNGKLRAQFKADRAFLPQDDEAFVRAHGITVEMFSDAGIFEGVFLADNCIYDRSTRSGYCVGFVRLLYRNVTITGTNMVWHMENRNAKILSHSKVVLNRFSEGMKGAFKR